VWREVMLINEQP